MRKLRIFACILLCAVMLFSSCTYSEVTGSEFARIFLADICNMDFASAYKKVNESTKNTISQDEFVALYNQIIEGLSVESISYKFISQQESINTTVFKYELTYHSTFAGEITDEYRLCVSKGQNEKWCVLWSPSLILPEMEYGATIKTSRILPQRGEILASNEVLATNIYTTALSVVTHEKTDEELDSIATEIHRLLPDLPKDKILTQMKEKSYNGVALIREFFPNSLSDELKDKLSEINGVRIERSSVSTVRYYPHSTMLSHFLGYVQSPTEEEIENLNSALGEDDWKYDNSSKIGMSGLEKVYEKYLRGEPGYSVYLSSKDGVRLRTLYSEPAKNGYDIQLTIDFELQQRTEELLQNILIDEEDMTGAVVVLQPKTGDVLAAASYPSFDLNMFVRGITDSEYQALQNNNALFNRVLQGRYPPGSTYKVFTAAAALNYGVLSKDYVFTGTIVEDYWTPTEYGPWIWPAIKRATVKRRETPLNMRNALLHSDNIYFANAALMLGDDRMIEFWNSLGLDKAIDFELPVATSQYKGNEERHYKYLADSGYGQGTMLVTPIQLAATYCAFANGGSIPTPHIIDSICEMQGKDYLTVYQTGTTFWRENAIHRNIINTLLPMMKDIMSSEYNGTGQRLKVRSCVAAGKTGTAQIGGDDSHEISWIVAFRTGVDAKDERLVLVMLEIPNNDAYSEFKFTIARELLELKDNE